tara:strand:- start:336 stop:1454 length:1119 start_codon:yes stop_codon:yes gene_type:complete
MKNLKQINLKKVKDSFYLFRPQVLRKKVKYFLNNFKGKIIYSTKCNSSKFLLELLYELGINSFDASSIDEIKLLRNLFPDSKIFFMNPIKPRYAISRAYFKYNVKHFVVDNEVELKKINQETFFADDLVLFLRLAIPNSFSKIPLNKKYGVTDSEAIKLLKQMKKFSKNLGITFHPGSQCTNPKAYELGFKKYSELTKKCDIKIKFLSIGGGFPSNYSGMNPPSLKNYFDIINTRFREISNTDKNLKLVAEPGRAIVSDCMSLVVRVDLRKGRKLFINDGIYGSLNNAGYYGFRYPVKLLREVNKTSKLLPFSFFGPTCASDDFMKGPFFLPSCIQEGDLIEIFEVGAYSKMLNTNFNGFNQNTKVFLDQRN